MANSLTSSGLTIGTLSNTIAEFIDPNNSKMVIGDNANVSATLSSVTTEYHNSATVTLPALSIGRSGSGAYSIGRLATQYGGTVTVKLPASGIYAYKTVSISYDAINGWGGTSLSMNIISASRGTGTTLGSEASSDPITRNGLAVLYYRLK